MLDISVAGNAHLSSHFGYYLEATIVPPAIQQSYVYFSTGAAAQATFTITGLASASFDSDQLEIFSAGFPGLYYPGLLTLGPSLHLYAQLTGQLSMSGKFQTSVGYTFPSFDVTIGKEDSNPDSETVGPPVKPDNDNYGYDFSLGYNVALEGSVEAHVIPTLQLGLSILGGQLMDAQIFADVDLYAGVSVNGSVSKANAPDFCVQPYYGVTVNGGLTGSLLWWRGNPSFARLYADKFNFGGKCFLSVTEVDGSGFKNSRRDDSYIIKHSESSGPAISIPRHSESVAYSALESVGGEVTNTRGVDREQALNPRAGVPFLPGNLFCPEVGTSIQNTTAGSDCIIYDDADDDVDLGNLKRSFGLNDYLTAVNSSDTPFKQLERTSRLSTCPGVLITIPEYDQT